MSAALEYLSLDAIVVLICGSNEERPCASTQPEDTFVLLYFATNMIKADGNYLSPIGRRLTGLSNRGWTTENYLERKTLDDRVSKLWIPATPSLPR